MKPDRRDHRVKAMEAIVGRMLADLGEEHDTGRRMKAEVVRLRMAAEALDRQNATRNPLDTPAAHAMKVAKNARTFDREITNTLNRALKIWGEGYQSIDRRIAEKVNLTPDAFASEIRAAFRNMPPKQQSKLIADLVESNRGPELAAIVKAPSILTGISDSQRDSYEKMILARHAGAELDEIAKLEEVLQAVTTISKTAGEFAAELTDPNKLAAIESAAGEADAAGEAFNQALQ